jgi:hypothetical protein
MCRPFNRSAPSHAASDFLGAEQGRDRGECHAARHHPGGGGAAAAGGQGREAAGARAAADGVIRHALRRGPGVLASRRCYRTGMPVCNC